MNQKQNYLHGAAVLTAGVIIMKILGAIYKIPLYNIMGNEGFTYYNVAYDLYNVLLTVSTAGFPVALSRMISESNSLGRTAQVRRIFRVALVTFALLGFAGMLLMLLFPTELAVMMNKVRSAQSIFVLAPSVFLVCILSAYRGYIQGHSYMTPTSVSQVLEVAVKVLVGLVLVYAAARAGRSVPELAAFAIIGVPAGSLVSCLYIVFKKYKFEREMTKPSGSPDVPDSSPAIFRQLVKIGIPISLGSMVMSIITLLDTTLTLNRLETAAGLLESQVDQLFGVYKAVITLYNIPAAFITTLTISVVPAIAAALAQRKLAQAREIGESSLRIATILAMPMGVGLSVLSYPVTFGLFSDMTAEGPVMMAVMGVASYFVCMSLVSNAILQAGGAEKLPIISMTVSGIIKVVVNWFLVSNPRINILGAPVGTLCCYAAMCVINYFFIIWRFSGGVKLSKILPRPMLSSAVMGAVAWLAYTLTAKILGPELSRLELLISMCAGVAAGVVSYALMIVSTRAIMAEDLQFIPQRDKLAKILRIE